MLKYKTSSTYETKEINLYKYQNKDYKVATITIRSNWNKEDFICLHKMFPDCYFIGINNRRYPIRDISIDSIFRYYYK